MLLARTDFLRIVAVAGAGWTLGLEARETPAGAASGGWSSLGWVRLDADGLATVMINKAEMGQGVTTSLPMLVAEELELPLERMRFTLAPAEARWNPPGRDAMSTGCSQTIKQMTPVMRKAGATAKTMLVSAAANRWAVDPTACHARIGVVYGPAGQHADYRELLADAAALPIPADVTLKTPEQIVLLGSRPRRLDVRQKTNGTAIYGLDFRVPGMKFASIEKPREIGGTVTSFDKAAALRIPGVRAVYAVSSGVAVVADNTWAAFQGRRVLNATFGHGPNAGASTPAMLTTMRELVTQPGAVVKNIGDARAALASGTVVRATYDVPYLAHAPMEPLNCVIDLQADACTMWVGSQFQTFDQMAIARTAGLKPEQVTLHTMMAGGGFGRRAVPSSDYVVEAVNVAKVYLASGKKGALKVIWSREDDIKGGYYRPSHLHRAEIGLDEKGNIVAWDHNIVGQSIISGTPFEPMMVKNGVDATMIEGMGEPYQVPLKLAVHNAKQNVPVLWWRSVGSTHTAFVMETLIDEAAQVAGVDPVAYRKQLIGNEHPRHIAALDLAVEKSGYGKKALPAGHAWGVAVHESFNTVVAYVVEASVEKGVPKLHRVTGAIHCNLAVNPLTIEAQAQGAILMGLGMTLPGAAITLKDGVVEQQNFSEYTVARMPDMPQVAIHIVPSNDPPSGMGEPGLPPLAPAFANALAKLTGKRLRKLPFDLANA